MDLSPMLWILAALAVGAIGLTVVVRVQDRSGHVPPTSMFAAAGIVMSLLALVTVTAAAQFSHQRVPVLGRHPDIGDDHIEPSLAQHGEGLVGALHRRHVGTGLAQSCGRHLTRARVIVDHEHTHAVQDREGRRVN